MRIVERPSRRRRLAPILPPLLLSVLLAACELDTVGLLEALGTERATQVTVTPLEVTASVGETRQFEVEVRNQHGKVMADAKVTWISRTPDIASVGEGGRTEALSQGTAMIEATSGEAAGTAILLVDDPAPPSERGRPGTVTDLRTAGATATSVDLTFTEVHDGAGGPARYRIGYAPSSAGSSWPDEYTTVTRGGCAEPVEGSEVGAALACEVPGLQPGTEYDFRLIAFRENGNGSRTVGDPSNRVTDSTEDEGAAPGTPRTVRDLRTTGATSRSVHLAFTEVDDGTGDPAFYRVRYAPSASDPSWPDDFINVTEGGCAIPAEGIEVGATYTCEVFGLVPGVEYDFGLVAYRYNEEGSRVFGQESNLATGRTDAPAVGGIWIAPSTLAGLPMSGSAWDNVKRMADGTCPSFELSDQNNRNNTCVMAKALVYARTGNPVYLTAVIDALRALTSMGTYDGRALAMGRNLGAYAIAADLVGLPNLDPTLDAALRSKFRELLTTPTYGAASSLVDCHENRPNNWGTHCGGARAAVAVYLEDDDELARTAQVFRGFLGERSSYAGFTFGGPYNSRDHSWECDESRPVGINPRGCRKGGRNLDGVIPDDQRRGGSFDPDDWPPGRELYVWEALQGIMMQGVILERAGYPAFQWGDRAILRAVTWLHEVADFPADRGNTWQPHIVNSFYGSSFPAPNPTRYGKNVGWTDWTHR